MWCQASSGKGGGGGEFAAVRKHEEGRAGYN